MWSQASELNDKADYAGDISFYDTCGLGDSAGGMNTNWSVILAFNAVLYLIHTSMTLLICVGTYSFPLILVGGCGHCCGFFV